MQTTTFWKARTGCICRQIIIFNISFPSYSRGRDLRTTKGKSYLNNTRYNRNTKCSFSEPNSLPILFKTHEILNSPSQKSLKWPWMLAGCICMDCQVKIGLPAFLTNIFHSRLSSTSSFSSPILQAYLHTHSLYHIIYTSIFFVCPFLIVPDYYSFDRWTCRNLG